MSVLPFIEMALIIPGIACAYAFLVRPMLAAMPQFKKFYAEADGVWAKVWAVCGKSATVVWGYFLAATGAGLQFLDPAAAVVGDPDMHDQITKYLAAHPQVLGYFLMFASAVTIAARLRTLTKV